MYCVIFDIDVDVLVDVCTLPVIAMQRKGVQLVSGCYIMSIPGEISLLPICSFAASWLGRDVLSTLVIVCCTVLPCLSLSQVNVQVVQLTSTRTQIPFDFYSAPYCSTRKHTTEPENLGEVSEGEDFYASVLVLVLFWFWYPRAPLGLCLVRTIPFLKPMVWSCRVLLAALVLSPLVRLECGVMTDGDGDASDTTGDSTITLTLRVDDPEQLVS